jgi:mitochondrial inner membrane protease subunit 1
MLSSPLFSLPPPLQCVGPSMLPTFRSDGDIVIVEKTLIEPYQVGDVVICQSVSNPKKTVCKRIGALPGDFVLLETRLGSINYQIPVDHIWLLGDNPFNSHDSRHYGPVPMSMLKGRVVRKIRLLEFPSIVQKVEREKPSLREYP